LGAPPHELGSRTLLDGRPNANETSHGRSLPLEEVLAALGRFSAVLTAVSQPFLRRSWAENGRKLGFLTGVRPSLALHGLETHLKLRVVL
jgi:hypothetical protein